MIERKFNSTQAITKGWDIFACDGYATGDWQIQKIDFPSERNEAYDEGDPNRLPFEEALFASDNEVWAHVVNRALAGSAYHQGALAFIRKHSPQEWAAILKAHPELMPRIRVPANTRKAA